METELHNTVFQETLIIDINMDGVILWIIQGVKKMLFSNCKRVIYENCNIVMQSLKVEKTQMCTIVLGNYRLGIG